MTQRGAWHTSTLFPFRKMWPETRRLGLNRKRHGSFGIALMWHNRRSVAQIHKISFTYLQRKHLKTGGFLNKQTNLVGDRTRHLSAWFFVDQLDFFTTSYGGCGFRNGAMYDNACLSGCNLWVSGLLSSCLRKTKTVGSEDIHKSIHLKLWTFCMKDKTYIYLYTYLFVSFYCLCLCR